MNQWTTKTFHGRFTHRLLIDTKSIIDDPVSWCRKHHGKSWRKLNHYDRSSGHRVRHAVTIYCDAAAHDDLMQRYGDNVMQVSRPVDAEHDLLLKQGVQICIRDRLWFNRYRYSVMFWSNRRNPRDLHRWAEQAFDGDRGQYQIRGRWSPIMYLRDESALTLVKLTQNDRISAVRKVLLLRELPR